MQRLNEQRLSELGADVQQPTYRREEHASGIVHIGIGAFHRAHQAVYTDDLLNHSGGDWRITAVSLRSASTRDQMAAQDCLYTVAEKSTNQTKRRVIGAISKVLVAPESPQAVVDALSADDTKVVTLTITEKGYCRRADNGRLDTDLPEVQHDFAAPDSPKTMPGLIVAACAQRQIREAAGFTLISCDNLPENGRVTEQIVLDMAERLSPNTVRWIRQHVRFCNTMVDRIVPATTEEDVQHAAKELGVEDRALVTCEPFQQWVIEDNFATDKPRWDRVGATFTKDVTAYEKMKLRLLNGTHSALAYIGKLAGYEFIHQTLESDALRRFACALMQQSAHTLTPIIDVDFAEYQQQVLSRFNNSAVPYRTQQVAGDGSQKLPQRTFIVSQELLAQGEAPRHHAFVTAAWLAYLSGQDQSGTSFSIQDPMLDKLHRLLSDHNESHLVSTFIKRSGLFPEPLCQDHSFIKLVSQYYQNIQTTPIASLLNEI